LINQVQQYQKRNKMKRSENQKKTKRNEREMQQKERKPVAAAIIVALGPLVLSFPATCL